ncbi:hypothetical protein BCR39DRAFT_517407 [Naematelia encephala]|uniref:Bud emergence protein 1 n=1 Tax=Naematelia encephala TaxID=71784 RepID=A0A1Y2BIA1_9TREE|nr:hypothetical protein BCR39DRAFT_517407 [Naematelia encephala]
MKSLRRSLNNTANPPQPSPPLPPHVNPLGRPSEKVAPPQKVIKALTTHRSANPQELSFTLGDFFHVTGERDGWYEALNPLTMSRGLVPKSEFEEFSKGGKSTRPGSTEPQSRSHTPSLSTTSNPRSPPVMSPPVPDTRKPRQPVYAIVQYDFQAERPDELDAKKGEPIVVIAQSNHEWFVAKPIGRLGGPGLIPVAFVEIRDPATGRPIDVLPDSIPMVEEWKKATADYKAAAIPLGRFDMPAEQAVVNSPYAPMNGNSQSSLPRSSVASVKAPLYRPEQDPMLPPGDFTNLGVPSFHNESGNYWFRLHVTFVPDDPTGPAYSLSLYRTYEDFYDFQITLLDTFPYEAGRPREEDREPPERILPYMPGPVEDEIDDELTEYRREELDAYVKALLELRTKQAGYIVRHELFRSFFAAKYGDYCEEVPRDDAVQELEERLADTRLADEQQNSRSASAMSRHSQPSRPNPSRQGTSQSTSSRAASPLPNLDPAPRRQSSTNQPPYIKIKIYDRVTDDLIALRVHPNVTHAELFDKVRNRLGPEVTTLRYRTSMGAGQQYRDIRDDKELRDWMRTEDQKLVLYAEQE